MEGLSAEILSFLVEIKENGAAQLSAVSTQFKALSTSADLVSRQLMVLQKQFDTLTVQSTAAGTKMTTSAKAAVANTKLQTDATGALSKAQEGQVGSTDAAAAATGRLAEVQKAQTDTAAGSAGALDAHTAAATGAADAAGGASLATKGHSGSLSDHTSKLEKATKGTREFGNALMPVSVGLLAVGGYAVKMGLDFEGSMERLHTQAGYAQKDIAGLEAQVLKAAPGLRRTPTELAEGLYHVASVGIPAADAMKVMAAASIGANIGGSNLDATANALVITLKNMHQPATSATADMALLNEIVGAGNLHMEELVGVLGKVLPQATNVGLNLRDVGSAMDVLTSRGLPAARAATILGQTFSKLEAPSSTAQTSFAQIGLSSSSLAEEMRKPDGLVGAVSMLKDHLDKAFPPGKDLSSEQKRQALLLYKKSLEESGTSAAATGKDLETYAGKLAQTGGAATAQSQILINAFGGSRMSAGVLTLIQNIGDLRKTYQRLPEGAVAIKQFQSDQKDWEKTSQATLDGIKSQFDTTMTAVGKDLGPIVLPALKEATTLVGDLGEAFQNASSPVKHMVGDVLGVLAVAGPGLILISKFAHLGSEIGGVVSKVAGRGGGATSAVAGAGGAATLGADAQTMVKLNLVGFSGNPSLVGSEMNPLAVQMIGAGSSLGGGIKTGESATVAAEGEATSKGGVILPSGAAVGEKAVASEVAPLAEGAAPMAAVAAAPAAIGVGSKLLGVAGTAASRLMPAGMIALGGTMLSKFVGGEIGGKTGKDVSSVGSDASIGAAIGTVIAPGLGTAIGGALGASVGVIKILDHTETKGEKAVAQVVGGKDQPHLSSAAQSTVTANLEKRFGDVEKEVKKIEGHRAVTGETEQGKRILAPLSVSQQHGIATTEQAGHLYQGQQAGAAEANYVLEGVKYPDMSSIIRVAKAKMDELSPVAQHGYAEMMQAAVKELEADKRLPEGSLKTLNKNLAGIFGSLAGEAGGAGALSMKALGDFQGSAGALNSAKGFVALLRKEWSGIPAAANITQREAGGFFEKGGERLKEIIASSTGEEKAVAERNYKELKEHAAAFYGEITKEAEANLSTLAHHSGPLSKAGTEQVEHAYEQMRKTVEAEVRLGVLSPKQGLEKLAQETPSLALAATNPIVLAFQKMQGKVGGAVGELVNVVTPAMAKIIKETQADVTKLIGSNASSNLGQSPAASSPGAVHGKEPFSGGGARGMRVPGPVGPDNTGIYSPGGGLRGVVAGGELLVANRHTEQRVDDMLRPYGTSLGAEVAGERTPHSAAPRYATGGTLSYSQLEGLWESGGGPATVAPIAAAIAMAESAGRDVMQQGQPFATTGWGYWQITPGGPQYLDPMTNARKAVADYHERGFEPWTTFNDGAYRQFLHGNIPASAAPGGGAMAAFKAIHDPKWTGPGGAIGAIGRAALHKATAAANAKLQRLAAQHPAAGAAGASVTAPGGAPTGGGFTPGQLGSFDGFQVADWIIPELQYARAHGWSGPITSGYRAGADPMAPDGSEHALDIYPGGAVDFGGMHEAAAEANRAAFIAATAGYTGKQLLTPIGFVDTGHMSGTGHALGGRSYAGRFGGGGAVTASSPTMAMFGDNGTETAIFVPHAETGAELLASIGIQPKTPAGSKETEGLNPDNNQIEMHTAAEWRRIRNLHSQAVHAKGKAAKLPTVEQAVDVGGTQVASILSKETGTIDIPKDLAGLKATVWKKVLAAIEKTLKETTGGLTDIGFDVVTAHRLAQDPHGARGRELAAGAITASAKSIATITKNMPADKAVSADQTALAALQNLIQDAKRSANKQLVAGLEKTVEQTSLAYVKALGERATAKLAPIESGGKLAEIHAKLALVHKNAGLSVDKKVEEGADPGIEQARLAMAGATQASLQGSDTALRKADKEAHKHHQHALIALINKELEQVDTALGESRLNTATITAEYEKGVREQIQKTVTEAIAAVTTNINLAATHLQTAEALAKNKGELVNLGTFQASVGEQISGKRSEQSMLESDLAQHGGEMTAAEWQAAEEKIAGLTLAIVQLEGSVQEQIKATVAAMNAEQESHEALTTSQYKGAEIGEQLAGTNLAGYEEDATKQSGLLTPAQVAGANAAEARFAERREAEEHEKEQQKAADEQFYAEHPATSAGEQQEREQLLQNLGNEIGELAVAIQGNVKATEKLEETTKEGTKVMAQFTGSVTFQYQSQQYVVGQTSDLSSNALAVG